MSVDWTAYFPPGTRVVALPSWQRARLYVPAQPLLQHWEDSSFYPATRFLARVYRLFLRSRAAAGLAEVRQVRSGAWPLGEYAQDVLPRARSAAVLVGTPGPAQKITVRVLDERGEVLGYIKYAEKEAARRRLEQERRLLERLPEGAGPKLLKSGPFGDGVALVTTALVGSKVPAILRVAGDLAEYLASLVLSPPMPFEAHPWVRLMRERAGSDLEAWFTLLATRRWPVVVQHGDFAPWNLIRKPDGALGAIDWEYGTLEGLPNLDLAFYVLQVQALVRRRSPQKGAKHAIEYLTRQRRLMLSRQEAAVFTRLAAYDAYLKAREDGQRDDSGLQTWRRVVWECT